MAKRPMFTKEDLLSLYVAKQMTLTEIAELIPCDRNNVKYYLKKYGIPLRSAKETMARHRKSELTGHDIARLIESGKLISEIMEEHGISRGVVRTRLKEDGYNFRNHKAARAKQSEFMKGNNPREIEEVARRAHENALKTRRAEYVAKYSEWVDMDFKTYAKKARAIAYQEFGRGNYQGEIDHIFSVKAGYDNNVPLMVISHPANLRLLAIADNKKKAHNSDMTLSELYELTKGGIERVN